MTLIETLKKQGGVTLLRRYWKSGAFFTAFGELLLLGKSRTSLEILRLSAELKTKQKLKKMYISKLKEFDKSYDATIPHKSSNKVWVCWFQGIEDAPKLVQRCYESIKRNLTESDIILITESNMHEYILFPDYIMKKWKSGQITHTHMTDLLRIALLTKYGGTWIDATVFCTRKQNAIPSYFFDSELFFFQCLKPGRDGHATYISSWYMSAKSNNKILAAVQYLCNEYWKENKELLDYFLLHDFVSIVLEYYPEEWKKIIPRDNATPHELLLILFEDYNEQMWEAISDQVPFHKLSYKFEDEKFKQKGTFYEKVVLGEDK